MPVSAQCQCGKRYNAKDEAAGKTVKCPACGQQMTFPALPVDQDDPFGIGNPQWQPPASPDPEPGIAPKVVEPPPLPSEVVQWFYSKGDAKEGPVSTQTIKAMLKQGELANDTLLWREGMTEWKTVAVLLGQTPTEPAPATPSISGYASVFLLFLLIAVVLGGVVFKTVVMDKSRNAALDRQIQNHMSNIDRIGREATGTCGRCGGRLFSAYATKCPHCGTDL